MLGRGMMLFLCEQKTAYVMRISDWSSDVCSSDLGLRGRRPARAAPGRARVQPLGGERAARRQRGGRRRVLERPRPAIAGTVGGAGIRSSEERRVGNECVSTCSSRWSPYHYHHNAQTNPSATLFHHLPLPTL